MVKSKSTSRRRQSSIFVSLVSLLFTLNLLCSQIQQQTQTLFFFGGCLAQQDYDSYDNDNVGTGGGGGGDYYNDGNNGGYYDDGNANYQYNDSMDDTSSGNAGDNLYADYAEHQQSKMMGNTKNYGGGYV
jgi:hypothetical protein